MNLIHVILLHVGQIVNVEKLMDKQSARVYKVI